MEYTELEKELIREAIQAQNACNLSGVVFSYARAMQSLCDLSHELGVGTEWKNTHPVCKLYAEKILHLCKGELSGTEFSKLYDLVNT